MPYISKENIIQFFASPMIKRSLGVLVLNASGLFLSLLLQIFLARMLDKEVFGAYQYLVSFLTAAVVFGTFGADGLAFRLISQFRATNEVSLAKGVESYSVSLAWSFSIGLAVVLFFLAEWLPDIFPSGVAEGLRVGVWVLPFLAVAMVYQSIIAGSRASFLARIPDLIFRPIFFVAIFWLVVDSDTGGASVNKLALTLLAATFCMFCVFAFLKRFVTRELVDIRAYTIREKEWQAQATGLFAITVLTALITQTDVLLLGYLTSVEDVAVYSVAQKFSQFLLFGSFAVNLVSGPMLSGLNKLNGKRDSLQSTLRTVATSYVIFALPVACLFVVEGDFLLGLFGDGYSDGLAILLILSLGQFIAAVFGAAGFMLTISELRKEMITILLKVELLNLVGIVILTKCWGLIGAAVASAAAMFILNFCLALEVRRRVGLDTSFMGIIGVFFKH
jgi:O-antigen/teichoic acid export membrane protein